MLRAETHDDLLVYHLQRDWTQAPLDERERAILRYAELLNGEPDKVREADIQALRDAGLDDRAILDVVMIVSLFNFMNRLADGLGLQPDEKFVKARERGEARVAEQGGGDQAQAGG